ncbi:nuclear transport factor 2 family protein [Candidatus Poriferisocius sp.]|uniref:nuclear transport factor 2 family protein n=1 Tax=Candidatus Poriferisocius sp. TaxID=3101276 RepID=UPI003B51E597
MTTDQASIEAVADRFFAAYAAADEDGIRGVLSPDFEGWTSSFGGRDLTVDTLVDGAKWEADNVIDMTLEEVRRHVTDRGFVRQFVIRLANAGGAPVEIPGCMVALVANGRITRFDEYLIMPTAGQE